MQHQKGNNPNNKTPGQMSGKSPDQMSSKSPDQRLKDLMRQKKMMRMNATARQQMMDKMGITKQDATNLRDNMSKMSNSDFVNKVQNNADPEIMSKLMEIVNEVRNRPQENNTEECASNSCSDKSCMDNSCVDNSCKMSMPQSNSANSVLDEFMK